MASPSDPISVVSECTILPDSKSPITSLPLSISDLSMLTFHYNQRGCLFGSPGSPSSELIPHLKRSLSKTLSVFPPLAGRFSTHPTTHRISIDCSDAGALFVHAHAPSLRGSHILHPSTVDVPVELTSRLFALGPFLSYEGHSLPLAAVQVTVLADSVFIGLTACHAALDGTSFWNFFNTFAEISRGATSISRPPSFSRENSVFNTDTAPRFPGGRPSVTFLGEEPTRERLFHFSREALLALKKKANDYSSPSISLDDEISSYQSLCAQVWRSVTRARNLTPTKTTTFLLPVNCRPRVHPKMDPLYFGNAIQEIKTVALAGEVLSREVGWSGGLLHRNVRAHTDRRVREAVEEWKRDPRCLSLGNPDGATNIVSCSPWLGMYDNDFGWGRPVAVRCGQVNKFDGMFAAFPGREGGGSVELEVVLAPETMAGLEMDVEFMQYVT